MRIALSSYQSIDLSVVDDVPTTRLVLTTPIDEHFVNRSVTAMLKEDDKRLIVEALGGTVQHPGMVYNVMTRGLAVQTYSALRKMLVPRQVVTLPGGRRPDDGAQITVEEDAALEKLVHRLGEAVPARSVR